MTWHMPSTHACCKLHLPAATDHSKVLACLGVSLLCSLLHTASRLLMCCSLGLKPKVPRAQMALARSRVHRSCALPDSSVLMCCSHVAPACRRAFTMWVQWCVWLLLHPALHPKCLHAILRSAAQRHSWCPSLKRRRTWVQLQAGQCPQGVA